MKDIKLRKLIRAELKRQEETINLIASENFASKDILGIVGSPLTNKYSEGYPGKRYYPGNRIYDAIELLAQERGLKVFRLNPAKWKVNVQAHSGSPANLAICTALMDPGETLMGMRLADGGHLTHGHKVSVTGKFWKPVQYGVDPVSGLIDYDEVRRLAQRHRPKIIISGFTAYPRRVDFKKFGDIAKSIGAYHIADISHIAGLVAAGVHPSPFPHADIVMATTHKTLRGPRGAVIFSREELSDKINRAVFPGLQGGPHNNITAGIAAMFYEAMQPGFKKYAARVVSNAKVLAKTLRAAGCAMISGGTDTHLLLLDVRSFGIDGHTAQDRLERAGIIANRNSIPGDSSPFKPSGIRIGTAAVTTRGMKEREIAIVGALIVDALRGVPGVRQKVLRLCKKFPVRQFLPAL